MKRVLMLELDAPRIYRKLLNGIFTLDYIGTLRKAYETEFELRGSANHQLVELLTPRKSLDL